MDLITLTQVYLTDGRSSFEKNAVQVPMRLYTKGIYTPVSLQWRIRFQVSGVIAHVVIGPDKVVTPGSTVPAQGLTNSLATPSSVVPSDIAFTMLNPVTVIIMINCPWTLLSLDI